MRDIKWYSKDIGGSGGYSDIRPYNEEGDF